MSAENVKKWLLGCFGLPIIALPLVWPTVDLWISSVFYRAGQGFFLADNPVFAAPHLMAVYGSRLLGIAIGLAGVWTWGRRTRLIGLDAKAWFFLLAALIIGPGLIANVGLKDHWGRARPREVVEFGGAADFAPIWQPHFENARSNESFVSGDGAFGFFLPSFAYVVPRRFSRRVFWGGIAAGCIFGFVRLAMGAHFLSDNICAAILMLAVSAGLHAAIYGRTDTAVRWRTFIKLTKLR